MVTVMALRDMHNRDDRLAVAIEATRLGMEAARRDIPRRRQYPENPHDDTAWAAHEAQEHALDADMQHEAEEQAERSVLVSAFPDTEGTAGRQVAAAFFRAVFDEAYTWSLDQHFGECAYAQPEDPPWTVETLALAVSGMHEAHALAHYLGTDK
jgi:hypothetical protein